MSDTILRVDDIQKYYGNKGSLTKAVDHISFTVDRGEFLGIMGPSGSGKTTLLNCISTIDTVTSGHIYVENQDITELHGGKLSEFRGKKLGFIFQDFNLLDTLTAYENISLALSIAGVKTVEIQKRVKKIGEALNISDVLSKYPYQMSGGQQQRIAAARAMVTNPAIVLADEPTGALDSNSSRMLLTMLTELNQSLSATILIVTHDAFSASYCSRILFIKDGKIFHELVRGNDSRKEFFSKILEVVSVLGGEQNDIL
ncbi:ABC transporter ATP-binding protein [Mediterraneibacter glycyrrhizinilyticus]|uniref:ABC transporter ATP-binding protein n=1 Tax=Mediterraneibacter glycyrrhizinilyticus TaxID=342942 RepID=UPI0025AA5444|nr:ABC transporter ATP-binding protein [Mediterraneibacter glycyrrhizinilyticus]MDN0042768.1 ABC transporter ATP-binding protein [Mediterraneibacter glycyrrhizinilyticus]